MHVEAIRIKKGYRLSACGRPSLELQRLKAPERVAFVPKSIPFIKPRVAVKEGDPVKAGGLLFWDKYRPELKFRSPGGGSVEAVRWGPRHVLEAVVIRVDAEEEAETFESLSESAIDTLKREELVARIMDGGLWALIRELPFRNIPPGQDTPPRIIVSMATQEPFEPQPAVYLKDQMELFQFGLRVLQRLAPEVSVVLPSGCDAPDALRRMATHGVSGDYPCGDAGVFLYHTKTGPGQNRSWYLRGQDVLLLARFLKEGRYPLERTVVRAGPMAQKPCHIATRMGVPLKVLGGFGTGNGACRFVAGGLFTGYPESETGYLDFYETAVGVLSGDPTPERLALFKPGYDKPSYTRAFLSCLRAGPLPVDGRYHGEERACIGCGFCAEVCPVEILPQFTFKAVLAGEWEEALDHGLLDCVECGLCAHVCPSKIDLTETLKKARRDLYREQLRP